MYSHFSWPLPPLSLGAARIISCITCKARANDPHRGLYFTRQPRRGQGRAWGIGGTAVHHFVLREFFGWPFERAERRACFAILLHRWKCLNSPAGSSADRQLLAVSRSRIRWPLREYWKLSGSKFGDLNHPVTHEPARHMSVFLRTSNTSIELPLPITTAMRMRKINQGIPFHIPSTLSE